MALKQPRQYGSVISNRTTGEVLLRFDANMEEKYSRSNTVTTRPIERGTPVTDNSQAGQFKVELNSWISNAPLVPVDNPDIDRATFFFQILDVIVAGGQRLNIETGYRVLENAIITDYSTTRDAKSGQILDVNLTIVDIEVVDNAEEDVPKEILEAALRASGAGKKSSKGGPQAETDEQKSEREGSTLWLLAN